MEEVADLRHEDVDEEVGLLVIVPAPLSLQGCLAHEKQPLATTLQ